MTDEEIAQALGGIQPDNPVWRAVTELLKRCAAEEVDNVANPALTDGARHFNAGRLARSMDTVELFSSRMNELHPVRKRD